MVNTTEEDDDHADPKHKVDKKLFTNDKQIVTPQ